MRRTCHDAARFHVIAIGWGTGRMIGVAANPPSWSLGTEAFFYLLFPLLLVLAGRTRRPVRTAAVIAIGAFAATLALGPIMGNDYQLYRFPPLRLAEFSIGMLVAVAMRHGWRPRLGLPTACAMVALAYGAGLVVWQHHPSMAVVTGLVGPSVALVIIAGAGRDLRGRQTPTWAVRLGHWSLAFYLIHWVILVMISGSSGGIGALAVALWISTVVSALLYSCFERPVERWLRRKGRRRSPAPLPAPARA